MAFTFDVNGANQAVSLQWYRFKELLKSVGWSVESSGTGASGTGSGVYDAAGDAITVGTLLANNRVWFVVKKPGGNSRFCIQTDGAGGSRIKYAVTPFTGGSPSASVVPSAVGEAVIHGGNTDASPTLSSLFDSPNRTNLIAGGEDENYCFLFLSHNNGVSGIRTAFMFDAMRAGSYPAEETDPHVTYISALNSGVMNSTSLNNMTDVNGYFLNADGTRRWTRYAMLTWLSQGATTTAIPGAVGVDVMTGNDLLFPPFVGRYGASGAGALGNAAPGNKGISRLIHWNGINRTFGDTLNIGGGTKNYLVVGGTTAPTACNVVIPWNGSDLTI